LQLYPIVVADALLEVGTADISAVLSLNEHLSQTLLVSGSVVTNLCIVVLFRTSLSGYARQHMVSMQSDFREWTRVLLVNTPCSHRHSVCASAVSSGLATGVNSSVYYSLLHGKFNLLVN
jgi:predicted nucleic acid-binding protein